MRVFTCSCALGPTCVCFRPQFESISAIWGGSGCQWVSCCTGSCSSPPRCNGRYLLLTCSSHTITERCGGNLCLYLHSLPSLLSASELQCLFCRPHTHIVTHTGTRLTQQFISIPNLWERMSSGVSTSCMAARINICTLIWPGLSSSIHPDIDWFSQQVSVSPIWLMGRVREGGGYWTRESHMPAVCYTTEQKSPGRRHQGQGYTWYRWAGPLTVSKSIYPSQNKPTRRPETFYIVRETHISSRGILQVSSRLLYLLFLLGTF